MNKGFRTFREKHETNKNIFVLYLPWQFTISMKSYIVDLSIVETLSKRSLDIK